MSESVPIATARREPATSNEIDLSKLERWTELLWQMLVKAMIAMPGLLLGLIAGVVIGLWTGLIQFSC